MIFHENRLLADDSHEISYLFLKIGKDVAKFVVCCSRDWRFKGSNNYLFFNIKCQEKNIVCRHLSIRLWVLDTGVSYRKPGMYRYRHHEILRAGMKRICGTMLGLQHIRQYIKR